jgi:putative restriction endonuclease
MHPEQVEKLSSQITVWKRGAERAPHKPLLLLYALAKCSRGEGRQITYKEIDTELRKLLIEFGPTRKSYHTEYPFWRLQNDGIWELQGIEGVKPRLSNNDAKKSDLLKFNPTGGFSKPIYGLLKSNPTLLRSIADGILDSNFPSSIHEDILAAVGLDDDLVPYLHKKRNPMFRIRVLTAYGYRCSVCNYDVRLGITPLGLEAAHIKWHQAGGPCIESNSLALCSIHHKMFDRGAFTLSDKLEILVSENVNGSQGVDEWLLRYHGSRVRSPQSPAYTPEFHYLRWHRDQVFHGTPRYLGMMIS